MMNPTHTLTIAEELTLDAARVQAVADLLEQDASVPFISRYRKEATGSLDEVAITAIRDRMVQLAELDKRRETILKSLEQHGHLTDELHQKILEAPTLSVLEDIYLPFRPKRRTRATKAREKGLAPLAEMILKQRGIDPFQEATAFIDPEKGVETVEDALAGARDILAEVINEDAEARARLRHLYATKALIKSRLAAEKEAEGAKYRDYFEWEEPAATAPSHRVLAMRRGEKEEVLNLSIQSPEALAIGLLEEQFVTGDGADSAQVRIALQDGYKRLLSRAMETEMRVASKERADMEAIRIFAENLRQLLMAPPLGDRRVMAIDPGFRTGCKLVCLDRQGKLLHHDTIYPHKSEAETRQAADKVHDLCQKFGIEAIGIGNGTAGRETEAFVRGLGLAAGIQITMVNESGASIYSASPIARKEFPDLDLTVRGAVSIGRRLMDPLSELVKIDPKSIGVGQYQHDVDQTALKSTLDDVVISCVNAVGVDVNRASAQLLMYVSGLGPQLAENIVTYRNANGPFASRTALKDVPRLGPKAFEQCAGFLRIHQGSNPLDGSAVHPESYHIVDAMAADLDCRVADLLNDPQLRGRVDLARYASDTVGLPTLEDILAELAKPGRDPREAFEEFAFASGIEQIEDLRPGMRLPGIVTNITAFGAFVDIGVHQDGLVHISEMADRFVKDPAQVVKLHEKVNVTVIDVDLERRRIALSMKSAPEKAQQRRQGSPRPQTKKRKGKGQKPAKPAAPKERPFNNPFAEFFDKS